MKDFAPPFAAHTHGHGLRLLEGQPGGRVIKARTEARNRPLAGRTGRRQYSDTSEALGEPPGRFYGVRIPAPTVLDRGEVGKQLRFGMKNARPGVRSGEGEGVEEVVEIVPGQRGR